ncbi:membrane protein [Dysgonomonas sp. PFB1-18]|uniref:YihY/virulence factor BrkB family protein n=1 Tax=unclassified Dysgonomonas TaxID=2630389 RepID=UPI002475B4C5|nr:MULTISPECIES: YihY/virulence factor BrkB family protein [unclassified Dysgonomonas]MDH6311023.1 membrane protein [Dysgonomonas sp. PF1-14]MDH6337872.1 membrane protein [Dysgonomonas sp. PF1-16]MDH6382571.1 membrane protein [Dysgonomonas sp. PFB1-18]MDH6398004.1 membrane protein [Dysgonomonas sp. PF1-23]
MIEKIKDFVKKLLHFLSYDIWRINKKDRSSRKIGLYNVIKTFILAIRNIDGSQLFTRASALTYSTLLSIVPLLAVLFAIARGFGFQNIVKTQLFSYFAGQEEMLDKAMAFIDKSIEYAQGGVFLGIGVVLLLYTVINLLSNIEDNFNNIWQIKKGRTYFRMFTDYLALIIIAPVFLICNAGLTIILSTTAEQQYLLGLVISPFMKIIPYLLTILLFTILYIYIPNTKVHFTSALLGGIFTGVCFQIFQMLYISGQFWITKYNAIYGSFAALPLLLLWLQLTWFLVLFGVQLSFAFQNVNKFSFEHETSNISRRYKDFITLLTMTLIVKRFEKGLPPYTADELSENYKIPTKLTGDTLFYLQQIGIIVETPTDDALVPAYIPSLDINHISVSYLFEKIDKYGSEDFIIDTDIQFRSEWETILAIREPSEYGSKLLKDL